jgi:hypothetical protein
MGVYVVGYPAWLFYSLLNHRWLIMHRDEIEWEYHERQAQGRLFSRDHQLWDDDDFRALVQYRAKYRLLFQYYKWNRWYFEFIELFRKIIMCGALVLFAPGSTSQVATGVIVCLAYYVCVVNLSPMNSVVDNALNQVASIQIVVTLMAGMLLKASQNDASTFSEFELFVLEVLLVILNFLVLGFGGLAILLALPIWQTERRRCHGCRRHRKSVVKGARTTGNTKVTPGVGDGKPRVSRRDTISRKATAATSRKKANLEQQSKMRKRQSATAAKSKVNRLSGGHPRGEPANADSAHRVPTPIATTPVATTPVATTPAAKVGAGDTVDIQSNLPAPARPSEQGESKDEATNQGTPRYQVRVKMRLTDHRTLAEL